MYIRDVSLGFVENVDDSLNRLCTFGAVQVSSGCSEYLEAGGHVDGDGGGDERRCYERKTCESVSFLMNWAGYLCCPKDILDAVQKRHRRPQFIAQRDVAILMSAHYLRDMKMLPRSEMFVRQAEPSFEVHITASPRRYNRT